MPVAVVQSCSHILIGNYEISADLNRIEANVGSESQDDSTFGAATRTFQGGLMTAKISGSGFVNLGSSLQDPLLFGAIGSDPTLVTVFYQGITDGSTYGSLGLATAAASYNVGGAVGVLLPFSFEASANAGRPVQAVSMWNGLAANSWSTDSTGGTIFPLSTAGWSTGMMVYGGLHITALSTALNSAGVTVTLQQASSSGAGFTAAAANRISFSAQTCKGAQFATPIGVASTDQPFWRARVTVATGTSTGNAASGLVWVGHQ